jgi:hypothetical protein
MDDIFNLFNNTNTVVNSSQQVQNQGNNMNMNMNMNQGKLNLFY